MDQRQRDDDAELRRVLTRLRPSVDFRRAAIQARITRSVDDGAPHGRSISARWIVRLAAAIAVFASGAAVGRLTAPGPASASPALNSLEGVDPATRIALDIQTAGSRYLAATAAIRQVEGQLGATELREAREVAVAVLGGAMVELGVGERREFSGEVLAVLMSGGIAVGSAATPAVLYR